MRRRSKNRQTALRLPEIPRLAIAATISPSVKSGCLTIRVSRKSACSSNGEVLPPLGFAATLPVCSKRCVQSTTTLALSSYRSATSRHDAPASQVVGIRPRHRSPPQNRINAARLARRQTLGNPPDSIRAKYALITGGVHRHTERRQSVRDPDLVRRTAQVGCRRVRHRTSETRMPTVLDVDASPSAGGSFAPVWLSGACPCLTPLRRQRGSS